MQSLALTEIGSKLSLYNSRRGQVQLDKWPQSWLIVIIKYFEKTVVLAACLCI